MKKLFILALVIIGVQQVWADNWVIVNSITVGQGAYAVVKTSDKNQEFTWVLKPGDANVFDTGSLNTPIDVSIYAADTDRLLYHAKGLNSRLSILRYQDGKGVFIDSIPSIGSSVGGEIFLVNAAPYPATYHVGYTVGTPFCRIDESSLNYGETKKINTGACITDNLHAWYQIGGKTVYTNKYQGRTGGGVFVFRKSAVDPNRFQVTGPWRLN